MGDKQESERRGKEGRQAQTRGITFTRDIFLAPPSRHGVLME